MENRQRRSVSTTAHEEKKLRFKERCSNKWSKEGTHVRTNYKSSNDKNYGEKGGEGRKKEGERKDLTLHVEGLLVCSALSSKFISRCPPR